MTAYPWIGEQTKIRVHLPVTQLGPFFLEGLILVITAAAVTTTPITTEQLLILNAHDRGTLLSAV